jgi:arsenate reductase
MIQLFHNSRCGKSRNFLAFIENSNKEFEIIKYLENPPTIAELTLILKKLNFKPIELVRQKETIWIEKYKNKPMTNFEIIKAMVENPILIERPIIIDGEKAYIARDLNTLCHLI